MSASTTIPATITPEAAARAKALGVQAELERILDHLRQTVVGLRSIDVVIRKVYDTYEEVGILVEVCRGVPYEPGDHTQSQWTDWVIANFPPQVLEHISVTFYYGAADAG